MFVEINPLGFIIENIKGNLTPESGILQSLFDASLGLG